MRILGIDTSGKTAAAALYDTDTGCLLAQQTVYTSRTHSQVILPMAQRLLEDTGLTWQDVDGLGAAKGPGSYTGLRIGIAAVKAMAFALEVPCVGISTLAGLAWQHLTHIGLICPVMAARQTLVYAGLYRSDGTKLTAVQEDSLMEQAALEALLDAVADPVLITGDGAASFAGHSQLQLAPMGTRLQNGAGICFGAAAVEQWQTPEALAPAYLQLVKAEKDLQDKMKRL